MGDSTSTNVTVAPGAPVAARAVPVPNRHEQMTFRERAQWDGILTNVDREWQQTADPTNPDTWERGTMTMLHLASALNRREALRWMLSNGGAVHIDTRNLRDGITRTAAEWHNSHGVPIVLGVTPLMQAAVNGSRECARMLLAAGADKTLLRMERMELVRMGVTTAEAIQWAWLGHGTAEEIATQHGDTVTAELIHNYVDPFIGW